MKFQYIYAHPDDETVGAAATMALLRSLGHSVQVVLTTDGSASSITTSAAQELKDRNISLTQLRQEETRRALACVGVDDVLFLNFADGMLSNQHVWLTKEKHGALTDKIIQGINNFKPDVVITFDPSGWYYHIDHIVTSIATQRAVQFAKHTPNIFFFKSFRPLDIKNSWNYYYSPEPLCSHLVSIHTVQDKKIAALEAHASQGLSKLADRIKSGVHTHELFYLVEATKTGVTLLNNELQQIFITQD